MPKHCKHILKNEYMVRGITTFKCTLCGEKFRAMDIEYAATVYSLPQKCPKCGSIRTRPAGLFGKLSEAVYRHIWNRMEESTQTRLP